MGSPRPYHLPTHTLLHITQYTQVVFSFSIHLRIKCSLVRNLDWCIVSTGSLCAHNNRSIEHVQKHCLRRLGEANGGDVVVAAVGGGDVAATGAVAAVCDDVAAGGGGGDAAAAGGDGAAGSDVDVKCSYCSKPLMIIPICCQ